MKIRQYLLKLCVEYSHLLWLAFLAHPVCIVFVTTY